MIYDEGRLSAHFVKRKLHYRWDVPEPKKQPDRTNRRRAWQKNPIRIAQEMKAILDAMDRPNQATVAMQFGVGRTRVCQYLKLLTLPGDIVEFIANPANEEKVAHISEGSLRRIAKLEDAAEQHQAFKRVLADTPFPSL